VLRGHFANHFLTGIGRNVNCEPLKWQEPAFEDFAKCWQMIQEGFRDRGLQKAVPVVFASTTADFSRTESRETLLRWILGKMLNLPVHLCLYGMWSEHSGMLGASPEVLFSRTSQNEVIHTMALAGTRGKVGVADSELLYKDRKERREHQLVVEDLKARLVEVGEVSVGSTRVLELPSLYHLLTPLQVCPSPKQQISFVDLVQLLHPTPALGVAPRILGFGEIRLWDQSGDTREHFGAPFGATWEGRDHCVVAIRNVQWRSDDVKLGSGCGVVSESEFAREWSEMSLKRESVKRMLGI
jgi:menaquinone-specific isochorismate synthase